MQNKLLASIYLELAEKGALLVEGKLKPEPLNKPVMRLSSGGVKTPQRPRRTFHQFLESFWERVEKTEACWNWSKGCNGKEYSRSYGVTWWNGVRLKCHKISFAVSKGNITDGMYVCHKCDNPRCVRPDHLFLGTAKDNLDDCVAKGRAYRERGEDRYCAKLNRFQVKEIRSRYQWRKYGVPKLSAEYGVSKTAIWNVLNGTRWAWVK